MVGPDILVQKLRVLWLRSLLLVGDSRMGISSRSVRIMHRLHLPPTNSRSTHNSARGKTYSHMHGPQPPAQAIRISRPCKVTPQGVSNASLFCGTLEPARMRWECGQVRVTRLRKGSNCAGVQRCQVCVPINTPPQLELSLRSS